MNTPEADQLKLYEVTHRATGERHFAVAYNAQDACSQSGWLIGDCYVIEQKPLSKYNKHDRAILLVKIPCQVCPYHYAECTKPTDAECPIRPDTTDPGQWRKEISKVLICPHIGDDLGKRDYNNRLKRTPLEQAIVELSPKPPPMPPISP